MTNEHEERLRRLLKITEWLRRSMMMEPQANDVSWACSELDRLRRRNEELEAVVSDLLEYVPPCDTDNPRVKQWCSAHQAKRCDGGEVRNRARAVLSQADDQGEGRR